MFLKSQSALAETQAIAANTNLGEEAVRAAQSAAASTAVSGGYFIIGICVVVAAGLSLAIKFSTEDEKATALEMNKANTPKFAVADK